MSVFTSEAVCKGHPDKLCDQVADAILDACLKQDRDSHVACEVCCTTGTIILMGEISTKAIVNYKDIARDVVHKIGYDNAEYGIDSQHCSVIDLIDKQSPEINNAVNKSLELRGPNTVDEYDMQGAGDQGIIFGYACNETKNYMPLSIYLAHELARKLEYVREHDTTTFLRPDGKTQVSVVYNDEGKITGIDTILVSAQHNPCVSEECLHHYILNNVINPVLLDCEVNSLCSDKTKYLINPSGSFVVGGPQGDTGLTGRKLAVDTYGGHAKFGGGAMCGKDPSKVDRSAAYMARYIAKHIVAAGYSDRCEVQISYAIGVAKPVSVNVNTFSRNSLNIPDGYISNVVNKLFDMRPAAIIETLGLKDYTYSNLSGKCQFGDNDAPWEVLDKSKLDSLIKYRLDYLKSYTSD